MCQNATDCLFLNSNFLVLQGSFWVRFCAAPGHFISVLTFTLSSC